MLGLASNHGKCRQFIFIRRSDHKRIGRRESRRLDNLCKCSHKVCNLLKTSTPSSIYVENPSVCFPRTRIGDCLCECAFWTQLADCWDLFWHCVLASPAGRSICHSPRPLCWPEPYELSSTLRLSVIGLILLSYDVSQVKLTSCETTPGHQASRTLQPSAFERVRVRCCRSAPGSSQVSPGGSSILGKAWIILAIPYEASISPKSSGTDALAAIPV